MSDGTSSAAKERTDAVRLFLGAGICFVFPIFLWLYFNSFLSARNQHRINSTYLQVDAVILNSGVSRWTGSKGRVHYDADVEYQYSIEGRSYRSKTLKPFLTWGDEEWAQSIVGHYPPTRKCQAYYDPQDPSQAVLIKGYTFSPYSEMFEMAACSAWMAFLMLRAWPGGGAKPCVMPAGWWEITPKPGRRRRRIAAWICSAMWMLFGFAPALHYLLYLPTPHPTRSLVIIGAFWALGLIPLGSALKYQRDCGIIEEAKLLLDSAVVRVGGSVNARISQRVLKDVPALDLKVTLAGIQTSRRGKQRDERVIHKEENCLMHHLPARAGQLLESTCEFSIPANQQPGGRLGRERNVSVRWEVRLETRSKSMAAYEATYPLEVLPAADGAAAGIATGENTVGAEVRQIGPANSGRILNRRNIIVGNLIGLVPLALTVIGILLVGLAGPVVFPQFCNWTDVLHVTKPTAVMMTVTGFIVIVAQLVYVFGYPVYLSGTYLRKVAEREIKRRPDAIVKPDAPGSLFVEIVPRKNWDRLMWETAADVGFLTVDEERREVRFEGDRERYRIPADAIQSCELEKSYLSKAASEKAPGNWVAVIRAYRDNGIWEAPIAVRLAKGGTKAKLRAAEELRSKIAALSKHSVRQAANS